MTALLSVILASMAISTGGSDRPPSAYVTSAGEQKRMATGSYCWPSADHTLCVDKAGIPKGPTVAAAPGRRLTFRFGFKPTKVTLFTGNGAVVLPARRRARWYVDREVEHLSLFVRLRGGDVSYAARAARR